MLVFGGLCGKDQLENKLETVPLQARSEEYWKHSCRWLLFEQLLFVPKHVTLSQKMPLVLLVSIPLALLTSSEVPSWAHRPGVSLCYVRKFPAFSHERFPLVGTECFENSRQETYDIEGSCKVYVGKTSWKTSWKLCLCKQEVKSTWNTLADDSYSRSI